MSVEPLRRGVEPTPPSEVGRAFRALSPADRRELLARLWAERGYDTRIDGEDVVAAADGAERLAAAADAGADYLDEGDLRDLLLYGIDRERGVALCRELLGIEPLVDPEAERSLDPVARLRANAAPIAAVLVVAAVLVAGAALPTTGGGGVSVDDATPANVTDGVRPVGAAPNATAANGTATNASADGAAAFPDGLSAGGVVDAEALASAHERVVEGRSYRFEYHFAGPASEEGFGDYRRISLSATVEAGERYLVEGRFVPGNASEPTVSVAVFANDRTQLIRRSVGGEVSYRRGLPGQGPGVTDDATDLVIRLLGAQDSAVIPLEDAETDAAFDVRVRDDPRTVPGDVRGYRAGALVDGDGFVRQLEASYTRIVDGEARQVQAGFEYDDVGVAVVERPAWYDEAVGDTETGTANDSDGAAVGGDPVTAGSSADKRRTADRESEVPPLRERSRAPPRARAPSG